MASEGLSWPEDYRMRLSADAPVQEHIAAVIDRLPQDKIDILDVGAGPITAIGKVHRSKQISVTATDVLAPEYNAMLAEFGVDAPVRTLHAEAEALRAYLGDRQFDIVHAQNSLDHVADPFAALEEMFALTRDGGFIILLHEENEGSNELYHALHKWDFADTAGHFTIAGPGPGGATRDVTAMFTGRAEVECSVDSGMLLVIMRKLPKSKTRAAGAMSAAER